MTLRIILLVEDNPSDGALTLRAFTKSGVKNEVFVTRDGAEALDYVFCTGSALRGPERGWIRYGAGPDGSQSPKAQLGLEALKVTSAENPATKMLPVVILTSSDEEEDRVKGYEFGANSFVRKPVEFDKFVAAVQQLGLCTRLL